MQVGSLIFILGSDRIVWTFLGDAYEPIRAWGRVATKLSKFNEACIPPLLPLANTTVPDDSELNLLTSSSLYLDTYSLTIFPI